MKRSICSIVLLLLLLPIIALSQGDEVMFEISVTFDVAYPENVTVALNCYAATPVYQTETVNPPDSVVLSVMGASEATTCRIAQWQIPDFPYTTTYWANGNQSDQRCDFGVDNFLAENTCLIAHVAWPVEKYESPGPIHGYQIVRQYGFIRGGSETKVEARCSPDKFVLGGGYTLLSGGAWNLMSLGPSLDGKGYFLQMMSESPEPQEVEVTAICAGSPRKDD